MSHGESASPSSCRRWVPDMEPVKAAARSCERAFGGTHRFSWRDASMRCSRQHHSYTRARQTRRCEYTTSLPRSRNARTLSLQTFSFLRIGISPEEARRCRMVMVQGQASGTEEHLKLNVCLERCRAAGSGVHRPMCSAKLTETRCRLQPLFNPRKGAS